jgi:hypothetical protein
MSSESRDVILDTDARHWEILVGMKLGKYANYNENKTVLYHAISHGNFSVAKQIVEQQTKTLLTHSILMLRTKQIPIDVEQAIMEFVCPGISSSSYGKYKAWGCNKEMDKEFPPRYLERHMEKIWDYIEVTFTGEYDTDIFDNQFDVFDDLLRLEMRTHKDKLYITVWDDADYYNIVHTVLEKFGVRQEACVDWKCAGFFTSVLYEIERGEVMARADDNRRLGYNLFAH